MRTIKTAASLIALSLFAIDGPPTLPNQDEGRKLLERVAETYKGLSSYHFEGTVRSEMGSQVKWDAAFVIAAVRPDKARVEVRNPAMDMEFLGVTNGRTAWQYLPGKRQYTKESQERSAQNELNFRIWALAMGVMLPDYEHVTERLINAKILRQEFVEIGGSARDCYVIEADYVPPFGLESTSRVFWVERGRYAVLKEVASNRMKSGPLGQPTSTYTTTFVVAQLNETLPETLFVFSPPQGAEKVKKLSSPEKKGAK